MTDGLKASDGVLPRMAAFIAERLAKPATLGGDTLLAVAETAERFDDSSWFWTDDNAKVAELLALPLLRERHPALADAALDFVLRMSEGPVIRRRSGMPELQVVSADPCAFHVRNAFVTVEGDLSRGVLRPSARFNDTRGQDVVHYAADVVLFRSRGLRHTVQVGDSVTEWGIDGQEDRIVLRYASAITVPALPLVGRGPRASVGTVRYQYTLWKDRSSLTLRVEWVPEPGAPVGDLVLSTGFDRCGEKVEFRSLALDGPEGRRVAGELGRRVQRPHTGQASYLALLQAGRPPGFSYAAHVLLRSGSRLKEVVTDCRRHGRLHRVSLRYGMGTPGDASSPGPCVVEEERLLTAGGYYDDCAHYAAIMAGEGDGGQDPTMTYDIGAELNAVAAHYLFAASGRYAAGSPSPERLTALRAWYDRHLQRYFQVLRPGEQEEAVQTFVRGLAFAALSLDCMLRATGDGLYRTRMDEAVQVLLRRFVRVPGGTDTWEGHFLDSETSWKPFLDVQAAAILAIARCAHHGDPGGEYGRVLREAVRAIKIATPTWSPGPGLVLTFDTLTVRAHGPDGTVLTDDPGYWMFKLGLLLRALDALRIASEVGAVELDAATVDRIDLLSQLARRFVGKSTRDHGGQLEVLTGIRSGEGNSETQPWVALGLDPALDRQIVAIPPPVAAPAEGCALQPA